MHSSSLNNFQKHTNSTEHLDNFMNNYFIMPHLYQIKTVWKIRIPQLKSSSAGFIPISNTIELKQQFCKN